MSVIKKPQRRFFLVTGMAFLLIGTVMLWLTSRVMYHRGIEDLSSQGTVKLELFVTYLQGVLKTYQSLPELLAIDDNLVNALLNPREDQRINKLNRYLETINAISDTADTYLMDKEGLTIAASNWQEEHPFVGRNFSYRPYFLEAMKGQLGRYFALGTTSSKRGYYFAYPVRRAGEILGVVVIKVNIDSVEQSWGERGDNFLVTDPDGVVFITTEPDWRYQTLHPLEETVRKQIIESRRYPNASLAVLTDTRQDLEGNRQIVHLHDQNNPVGRNHLLLTRNMPEAGWSVHILTDIQTVKKRVWWVNIMVGASLLLTFLLVLLLKQRQYRLAELTLIREKTRRTLQRANEKLELRVKERTRELTAINKLLRREIQDRQRTEETLRKTRNELIHAAKMAVLGQMSAGINHELNQPLAAIRSYTDNGKEFLKKGRHEEALWNLEQIAELTERMAQIGVQLKLFSRKTSGQMTVVPLHGVIDGALEILKPSIRKRGVQVNVRLVPENIEVKANNLLLQQVLINLISNAIQAAEPSDLKIVHVTAELNGNAVLIRVMDSGPGITAEDLPHIFEPFFTTKKSGQGLGLGLTISERILQEMRGSIRVIPQAKGQGACFEISLEKA
ncbi:sensor histidine kinase [Desulfopila aestuarii]|uniref:C4-dicarboxylate transport sensor protein DctB n=1 Tax=Desulfopila aestuarii DSM 18488 TaxID=1121416 RepID=A0A1M7Y1E2_9BACT|nr:ATP-binding protein [Desulfopila aestuarii]SHO45422.1 two-component system, NtrC family, C4-dicarboxylate transport sensor histidine kinase DctB [Desulfopila aestuarii DSM 18488]